MPCAAVCQALCCGLSRHLPVLALPAGRNGPVSRGRKPEPRGAESVVWAHAARQPDVNERLPLSAAPALTVFSGSQVGRSPISRGAWPLGWLWEWAEE